MSLLCLFPFSFYFLFVYYLLVLNCVNVNVILNTMTIHAYMLYCCMHLLVFALFRHRLHISTSYRMCAAVWLYNFHSTAGFWIYLFSTILRHAACASLLLRSRIILDVCVCAPLHVCVCAPFENVNCEFYCNFQWWKISIFIVLSSFGYT